MFEGAERAACRGMDLNIFYPDRLDHLAVMRSADPYPAKTVCEGCEVKVECLEYALDFGERWGCWGGTNEKERRSIRRRRRASPR